MYLISTVDWERALSARNIEEDWNRFADQLSIACKDNIPVGKSRPKTYNTPWMTDETLQAIKQKRKKWNKYKHCRSQHNKDHYEKARNEASYKVHQAQMNYEKEICRKAKTDSKVFWKYVHTKTKVKESIQCIKDDTDNIITDDKDKAKLLNNFFHSVFTKEPDSELPDFNVRSENELENLVFDEQKVKKLLSQVNENKSQGSDNIHPKLLRETAESIAKPVTTLFNTSMELGKIPKDWKHANITPIHKKGPKHNVSNYRPISLTSILCKIMEKLIRDSIMDHMEENRLFTKHQHGFRKGKSCVTQLIEVMERWTEDLDNKRPVDVIYLDFQKAFDTVPHKRLIHKLKAYGIKGKILCWIEDFLKNRKQRVVLNGKSSEWTEVSSGIPQGSVLGPILFTIYINDLPDALESVCKLFADDTKIFKSINNANDVNILQNDIDKLVNWSDRWLLKFNSSKCNHMHLGDSEAHSYKMGNDILNSVTEEKDLGIIIDSKLNFQQHISKQVNKANQKLGIIRRTFNHLDTEMLIQLYKSIVRPHLEYGSNIWSVIYKKEAILIENVQRRATRLVPELGNLTYGERLKKLGIPSLQYRRLRADMVETYKILNEIDKVEAEKIFDLSESTTRGHRYKLKKKHCRTNRRQYNFSQRVVNKWNSLPTEVVEAPTVNSFKNRLNKHWAELDIKFVPDFYGPEAGIRENVNMMDLRGSS